MNKAGTLVCLLVWSLGMTTSYAQPAKVVVIPMDSTIASAVETSGGDVKTYLTVNCTNHSAGNITIDVPGPGNVIVTSRVWLVIDHTQGTKDETIVALSTSPASGCSDWKYTALHTVPSSAPTGSQGNESVLVRKVFPVNSAGSYTFYLNGRQVYGITANTDHMWWTGTDAVFLP